MDFRIIKSQQETLDTNRKLIQLLLQFWILLLILAVPGNPFSSERNTPAGHMRSNPRSRRRLNKKLKNGFRNSTTILLGFLFCWLACWHCWNHTWPRVSVLCVTSGAHSSGFRECICSFSVIRKLSPSVHTACTMC